jgi:hypothetical protein
MLAKSRILQFLLLLLTAAVLQAQTIPSSLRGGISADQATIAQALEMQNQGWVYTMPEPKSAKAAWGVRDGRTTWWVGYWTNTQTKQTSSAMPTAVDGKWVGDGQGKPGWKRGGTPRAPTVLEWLLSKSGGVKPQ